MALQILPYTADVAPALREFHARLLAGGAPADQRFPDAGDPLLQPGSELFVAVDEGKVRGGYILRRQHFTAGRSDVTAAHYRLPLSEGIVDRAYAMLGLRLVRDALAREPRLYAMGMGGWDKPLPQMFKSLKWNMCAVPFHFLVVHPSRFLRHIRPLRTSALRRAVMDAAAVSGAGWLGMKAIGMARTPRRESCELADRFANWADEVWQRSVGDYALLARRDAATLDALYPASDKRFIRVRVAGGWAVLLDTQMRDHKQFGDMRVGTIVDCLAPAESAGAVVRAAAGVLAERGVDLIISNQLHETWSQALLGCGFRLGPSNYLLALSPKFAECTGGAAQSRFHANRGDGDGPIHL
ncbi:MAG: hypothetical protein ABI806_24325 [Candidatus Solibacter sp.]